MKLWKHSPLTALLMPLIIIMTITAQAIDWEALQVGDMVTLRTDAAAITPPAYALPPSAHPAFPEGIFFGDFFVAVTGQPYMHVAIYIGDGQFITADGAGAVIGAIGGVYVCPSWFIQMRAVDEPYVHRILPSVPPCIRAVIINRWIDKMGAYIGQPYDVSELSGLPRSFYLPNAAKYCSEIIWQAFKDAWFLELCAPVPAGNLNYAEWAFLLVPMGVQADQGIITLDGLMNSWIFTQVQGPEETEEEEEDPCG